MCESSILLPWRQTFSNCPHVMSVYRMFCCFTICFVHAYIVLSCTLYLPHSRSIGCIIYELCALEHAFSGQGLMHIMYNIVEKDPPELPPKYSQELDEIIHK